MACAVYPGRTKDYPLSGDDVVAASNTSNILFSVGAMFLSVRGWCVDTDFQVRDVTVLLVFQGAPRDTRQSCTACDNCVGLFFCWFCFWWGGGRCLSKNAVCRRQEYIYIFAED